MRREFVVRCARNWVGTPYLHQGRTRYGVDCLGLVLVVAHELGLSDYDTTGYTGHSGGKKMRDELRKRLDVIDIDRAKPGDVLHMAAGRDPIHMAIISSVNPTYIIHATSDRKKVIEQRLDQAMVRTIRGAYHIPGVY